MSMDRITDRKMAGCRDNVVTMAGKMAGGRIFQG